MLLNNGLGEWEKELSIRLRLVETYLHLLLVKLDFSPLAQNTHFF